MLIFLKQIIKRLIGNVHSYCFRNIVYKLFQILDTPFKELKQTSNREAAFWRNIIFKMREIKKKKTPISFLKKLYFLRHSKLLNFVLQMQRMYLNRSFWFFVYLHWVPSANPKEKKKERGKKKDRTKGEDKVAIKTFRL